MKLQLIKQFCWCWSRTKYLGRYWINPFDTITDLMFKTYGEDLEVVKIRKPFLEWFRGSDTRQLHIYLCDYFKLNYKDIIEWY